MLEEYLNKIVKVKIDRPIGSPHPKFNQILYEVNYGFIPNTVSGDGEEIDVYILRVDKPLKTFEGKVVAIINRKNDVENKLVVMPIDNCKNVTKKEIEEKTYFIEKYYKSNIILS